MTNACSHCGKRHPSSKCFKSTNHTGQRTNTPAGKKLASWLNLAGYDSGKKSEVITGLTEGFSQHYEGPDLSSEAKNHKSASKNFEIIEMKIGNENIKGRIAGPFKNQPFKKCRVPPLGLVSKKKT